MTRIGWFIRSMTRGELVAYLGGLALTPAYWTLRLASLKVTGLAYFGCFVALCAALSSWQRRRHAPPDTDRAV